MAPKGDRLSLLGPRIRCAPWFLLDDALGGLFGCIFSLRLGTKRKTDRLFRGSKSYKKAPMDPCVIGWGNHKSNNFWGSLGVPSCMSFDSGSSLGLEPRSFGDIFILTHTHVRKAFCDQSLSLWADYMGVCVCASFFRGPHPPSPNVGFAFWCSFTTTKKVPPQKRHTRMWTKSDKETRFLRGQVSVTREAFRSKNDDNDPWEYVFWLQPTFCFSISDLQ